MGYGLTNGVIAGAAKLTLEKPERRGKTVKHWVRRRDRET